MLPPIFVLWLSLELVMRASAVVPPEDFGPYDGPLAERLIPGVDPDHPARFEFIVDSPALRRFEGWLRTHPIHVRAPREAYLGWGLVTYPDLPGGVFVVTFNTLLAPHEQPLGPFEPPSADAIAWAWSVLDHYGLTWDPQKHGWLETRADLIESYREGAEAVDWQAVTERLRETGRPVPDDLFERHP